MGPRFFGGARPWGHTGRIFGPNYTQLGTRNSHDHVSGPLQSFLEDVTRIEKEKETILYSTALSTDLEAGPGLKF